MRRERSKRHCRLLQAGLTTQSEPLRLPMMPGIHGETRSYASSTSGSEGPFVHPGAQSSGVQVKIRGLSVANVKSFYREQTIAFDSGVNIFVGPNGGGKSNLLDILSVALRHFFLWSYGVGEGADQSGPFLTIAQQNIFA